MDSLSLIDLKDILSEYNIRYKVMRVKGRVVYPNKMIYLNPMFNEDEESIMHEVFHHYSDKVAGTYMPCEQIEDQAMKYLSTRLAAKRVIRDYIDKNSQSY